MKAMKNFFGSLFGTGKNPGQGAKPAAPVGRHAAREETGELYKKGDVIGDEFVVHRTLGKGGFGVVYLVYHRRTKSVWALKTFRDDLLADAGAHEAFKKEVLLWLNVVRQK